MPLSTAITAKSLNEGCLLCQPIAHPVTQSQGAQPLAWEARPSEIPMSALFVLLLHSVLSTPITQIKVKLNNVKKLLSI